MGVRDLISKFGNTNLGSNSDGEAQKPFKVPPPIPHATRPGSQTQSSAGTANAPPSLPTRPGGPSSSKPFVTTRNSQLILENGTPFRFASLNAPELLSGNEFEAEDTMRTLIGFGRRVTRTYTLQIKGTSPHVGDGYHIAGWDAEKGDWMYNEKAFKKMDAVLALADKYDVRLIIPVLNQDFGSHNNNWVGNWVDIVRHRKNPQWTYQEAKQKVDFFADRECIEATKLIYTFLLNRINTVNARRYGDDPTILAWETGNELQYNLKGKLPAPGEWTMEIARHIKSLAPRTLVMDGSFAKCDGIDKAYESQVAKSKEVELLSYHYYGNGDAQRVKKDAGYAKKHGKVFIAGEYGFLDHPNDYALFLGQCEREPACGGAMVWSLRPHSSKGGFKIHREDESNSAYHVPGWPSPVVPQNQFQLPKDWDIKEHTIVNYIRHASYGFNQEAVNLQSHLPLHPPEVWLSNDGSSNVVWKGSAWANSYELWVAPHESSPPEQWQCIAYGVLDAVEEGKLRFNLPQGLQGKALKMRGVDLAGIQGSWSNCITV